MASMRMSPTPIVMPIPETVALTVFAEEEILERVTVPHGFPLILVRVRCIQAMGSRRTQKQQRTGPPTREAKRQKYVSR
jgi:hypothetical protein